MSMYAPTIMAVFTILQCSSPQEWLGEKLSCVSDANASSTRVCVLKKEGATELANNFLPIYEVLVRVELYNSSKRTRRHIDVKTFTSF